MINQIRVGRRKYLPGGKFIDPDYEGFKKIICLTASTTWGDLGPYVLRNDEGQLMENIWQFSKVYESVPEVNEREHRYSENYWSHPKEIHMIGDNITKKYLLWREKGMNCDFPVRYPVSRKNVSKCIGAFSRVDEDELTLLDYVDARKEIYIPVYCDLVRKAKRYPKLQSIFKKENILIIEVDGPHEESLDYYKDKYSVSDDFIEDDTILINIENLKIMLNDTKYPFGHGYCLAAALLNIDKDICE